ncbi:MAG: hypothetical protein IT355_11705 [Gemmatimonadaceae bacterium]|nr:hypothetical protein [Gemmatimonadaceae bacterium]
MTETQERFLRTILGRVPLDSVVELHLFPPIRRGTLETGVAVVVTALPPEPPTLVGPDTDIAAADTGDTHFGDTQTGDSAPIAADATAEIGDTETGDSAPIATSEIGDSAPIAVDDTAEIGATEIGDSAPTEIGDSAPIATDATAEIGATEIGAEIGDSAPIAVDDTEAAHLGDSAPIASDDAESGDPAPVAATDADGADDSPCADEPASADAPPTTATAAQDDRLTMTDAAPDGAATPARRRMRISTASYRHTIKGVERGKWSVDLIEEADAPLEAVEAVLRGVRHRSSEPADPELIPHDVLAHLVAPLAVAPAA